MRLDKFLSSVGTRSEVKKLIKKGLVSVGGETVTDSGFQVSETDETVMYMGERVLYREFVYIIMNKPRGYVSATWDKHQPVVVDILSEELKRFEPFPVGRLDIDTEGLLILTNDGDLTHKLISPKKDVSKTYFARTDVPMEDADAKLFEAGMDLGDFTSKPAKLEFTDNPNEVYITISEGKFHQVKRMCEKCGKKVVFLKRISIGKLKLKDGLGIGEYYEVSKDELTASIFGMNK